MRCNKTPGDPVAARDRRDSRIDAVASGQVDLECGSTTSNLERQKRGGLLADACSSRAPGCWSGRARPIQSFRDLAGKPVAVTAGTTNEKTMRDLSARFKLGLDLVVSRDHAESFAHGEVRQGARPSRPTRCCSYGLIAQDRAARKARPTTRVVGDFLSYDPYGVMYRKGDPQLAKVVNDAFQVLAEDGEIERQYKRWFLRKLPGGTSLDLPMSPQLGDDHPGDGRARPSRPAGPEP